MQISHVSAAGRKLGFEKLWDFFATGFCFKRCFAKSTFCCQDNFGNVLIESRWGSTWQLGK
jgi:hypothetical protein